jgi:uncharacterized OsmC-like protein
LSDGYYVLDPDIGPLVAAQLGEHHQRSGRPVVRLESRAVRRFEFETLVEGHRFWSDESKARGGGGKSPAPLRYFVAGIVMCAEAWVIKVAALRSVPLSGLAAEASAYLEAGDDDPAPNSRGSGRGFDRIELTLRVDTAWPAERDPDVLAVAEDALRLCPAAVSAARAFELRLMVVHNGSEVARK